MGPVGSAGHRGRVATVLAVAALSVAGCTGGSGSDVEVADVGRATVVEVVEAPATVTARATATVTSPADGTVAALRVREGQQVRAGQVLLRVESPSRGAGSARPLRADARAASAGTSGSRRRRRPLRVPPGRRGRPSARVRPGPPGRPADPDPARAAAGAVRAAGLAVAVPRGPGRGRPGRRPSWPPASAACPTRWPPCRPPSGCRPGPPSRSRAQAVAALDGPGPGRRHRLAVAARRVVRRRRQRRRCWTSSPRACRARRASLLGGSSARRSVDAVLAEGRPVASRPGRAHRHRRVARSRSRAQVDETDVLLVPARRPGRRPSWTPSRTRRTRRP